MTVTSLGKRERTEPEDSSRPLHIAKLGNSSLSQLFTDHADELAYVASFLSARDMRYFPFVNSLCNQVIPFGMKIQLRDKETLSRDEIQRLFELFKPRYDQRQEDVDMLRFKRAPTLTDQTIFIVKMAPQLKFISLQSSLDFTQYGEHEELANCLKSKKAFEGIVSDDVVIAEAVIPVLRPWMQKIYAGGGTPMTDFPRAREIKFDYFSSIEANAAFQRFIEECPPKLTSLILGWNVSNPLHYVGAIFGAFKHLKDLSLTISQDPFELSLLNGAPVSLESLNLAFVENPNIEAPLFLPQVNNLTLHFYDLIPNPEVLFPFLRRAFPNLRHLDLRLREAPKELAPFVNSYLLESFALNFDDPIDENSINWQQLSRNWGGLLHLELDLTISENDLRNVLSACPELKSFTLAPQLGEDIPDRILITRNLLDFIANSCPKIEKLEILTPPPSLKKLLNFVSGLPYLRRLQLLENNSQYSLNELSQIAKTCPSLQEFKTALKKYDMKNLDDKALLDTTFLSREADLSDCPLVTYNGLLRISAKSVPPLEHVNLSGCTQFSPKDIHNFAIHSIPNKALELAQKDIEKSLIEENCSAIQPSPLKSLNLSRCTQLSLSDLLPIPWYCSSLETLIIKGIGLSEEDLQFLRSTYPNLKIIS